MGSHAIVKHVATTSDLQTAWSEIYAEARRENGSSPYSGTFGTCMGAVRVAEVMGLGEAHQLAEAFFSETSAPLNVKPKLLPAYADAGGNIRIFPEKWGAAFAIPVYDESGHRVREKSATISHDKPGVLHRSDLRELVETKIILPKHSWVEDCSVEKDVVRTRKSVNRSSGKRLVTWGLYTPRGERVNPGFEYQTEREALAAAGEILQDKVVSGWAGEAGRIEVRGIVVREGGASTVEIGVSQRKTTVSYRLCTATKHTQGGWLFFARAAC